MSWDSELRLTDAQRRLLGELATRRRLYLSKGAPLKHAAFALQRKGLATVQEEDGMLRVEPTEKALREFWSVSFVVPGRPVPKARPRVVRSGGRMRAYTPEPTKTFEEAVGWAAKTAIRQPVNWDVEVRVRFFVRRWHGDLDNLVKAVLDGMNGVVYEDDRQVVRLEAEVLEGRDEMTVVEVRRA